MMKCAAQLYLTIVSIVGLGVFFILHVGVNSLRPFLDCPTGYST